MFGLPLGEAFFIGFCVLMIIISIITMVCAILHWRNKVMPQAREDEQLIEGTLFLLRLPPARQLRKWRGKGGKNGRHTRRDN